MANVNLMMIGRIKARIPVAVFAVTPTLHKGTRGHLTKAWQALLAVCGIIGCRLRGTRTFYGSVDDGLGGVYTAAFAATARLAGMHLYIHHHSFRYIDRTTRQMRLITAAAGPAAHHIVLCQCMGHQLAQRYRRITNILVAPNSLEAPTAAKPDAATSEQGVLRLGLLSNLTFEKGLSTFVELLEKASNEGLHVRGVLGGPFGDGRSAAYYREAQERLGHLLSWRGALDGEAKDRFFASLDVFVFPTRYASEAYPLVVLEALLRGCPVISWDRGCLAEFERLKSCTIVPRDADFTPAALRVLGRFATEPGLLAARKAAAILEARSLNDANSQAVDALIDRLTGTDACPS
jgi:glycosyltransferase involved in cell wall biosynthesis